MKEKEMKKDSIVGGLKNQLAKIREKFTNPKKSLPQKA